MPILNDDAALKWTEVGHQRRANLPDSSSFYDGVVTAGMGDLVAPRPIPRAKKMNRAARRAAKKAK